MAWQELIEKQLSMLTRIQIHPKLAPNESEHDTRSRQESDPNSPHWVGTG